MRTILLTFIGLASLAIGCNNSHSQKTLAKQTWFDSTAFPKQPFSKVVLFVLDSAAQTTRYSPSKGLTIQDSTKVEFRGGGYTFINNASLPKTSEHMAYTLDSVQVQGLLKQLKQQPCTSSMVADKACSPIYRHVYVFYDKAQQPFAQAHVCFSCEKAAFVPAVDYMCDFDNKVDYAAFKAFTNNVKH